MNSVKIAYIICDLISGLAMLGVALLAPIYLTPGYYWWTAFMIFMLIAQSYGFSKRLNSWGDFGVLD